jgi:hypothetical protein
MMWLSRRFSPPISTFHPSNKIRLNLPFIFFISSSSTDSDKLGQRTASKKKPLRYLTVPFIEKDEAKRLGAKWDPESKRWFDPFPGNRNLDRWHCRKYLAVPFNEKEEAKSLGAKWDRTTKQWYDPSSESSALDRWRVNTTAILELKGEDRTYGGGDLFVDLVPSSCWFTNVRFCVHSSDWDRLRRHIYARAGNRCECCGDDTSQLEAHERWHYDVERRVQKLVRLIALCSYCHEATHMGLTGLRGRSDEATAHLRRVRGFTEEEAEAHISNAFQLWSERSRITWELDLSVITDSGIMLAREVDAGSRPQLAREALAAAESLDRATPSASPARHGARAAADPQPGTADDAEHRDKRDAAC